MEFEFYNPTHLIFGAGSLSRLGEVVGGYGKKALLVTGGGSVKKNGVFDRAVKSLEAAGLAVVECSGVEPTPRISSVRRGAKSARDEGCDVVVALGGGSTMDASKTIAAAILYDGDPWDMAFHSLAKFPAQALPVITAPTLAATGSEMDCGAVTTSEETLVTSFAQTECLYPRAAKASPARFAQSAVRILGVDANGKDSLTVALEGIDEFEEVLRSTGCPAPAVRGGHR